MIPISDETPRWQAPTVTWALIAINVVVFLYEVLLGPDVDQFLMTWGATPAYLTNPSGHPLAFVTLFTSMFLHSGWTHISGNMLYLWIFGDNVEDALGHKTYLLFYVAAGVLAGLAQVMAAPNATIPAIGASGAVAGVLGAYLVLYPGAPVRVLVPGRFRSHIIRMPAVIVLGMWFVIQMLNGFLSLGTEAMVTSGGTAWFAHIGGFVVGLAVGFVLRRRGVYEIA